MPELPDVENVVRMLRRTVRGRRIRRVTLVTPSTVRSPDPQTFVRGLRGRVVRDVGRRGKYILLRLDDGRTLAVHLRMTGDLAVVPRDEPRGRHTRVVFDIGGKELRFDDLRRFGHMDLAREASFAPLQRLGLEPLDRTFTRPAFRGLLDDRRGTVKALLLRQDLLAGIGNIYADEILWQARIHPARRVDALTEDDILRLHRRIRMVLQRAVAGLARYGHPVGRLLAVRDRDGHCPRCGRSLTIGRIAGRTTYFCSLCQR
jgi:formamidopyrimidine-DNA glycosylase